MLKLEKLVLRGLYVEVSKDNSAWLCALFINKLPLVYYSCLHLSHSSVRIAVLGSRFNANLGQQEKAQNPNAYPLAVD